MEYYKLLYDYNNDTDAGFIRIREENLTFDRYAVNESKILGADEVFCEIEQDNFSEYDYIANNLAWLVVSEKVKRVLECSNLGNHEFVAVKRTGSQEIVGYLVHCMNIINALDENKAVYLIKKYTIDGKEYERMSVIKYAVEAKYIGALDMFKLEGSNIPCFISSILRDKLIQSNAKGFDYLKIMVT